jgi:hypothetical protein
MFLAYHNIFYRLSKDIRDLKMLIGYAQNLVQLESAYQINKKKRISVSDFDYLYEIVSSGMD